MTAFTHKIAEADLPAAAAAAVPETPLGEVRGKYTVTEVSIISEAALTGATATARTLTVFNRGQAGAGTTVVATLALITGNDLVANDKKLFVLSATAANLNTENGDVLELVESVAGAGTARAVSTVTVYGNPRA